MNSKIIIEKGVVSGGPELSIPTDMSFGKYVLDKLRRANCNDIAMINGETHASISYEQLIEKIVRIANGLKINGIKKGDVVGLYSKNCTEYLAVVMGAICAGATVTTLNVKYTKDEIQNALDISKPRLMFCSEEALVNMVDLFRLGTSIERIVQLNGETRPGVTSLLQMEAKGNIDTYEPELTRGNDVAFIFYSSGTTGPPKGVMLTHRNIIYGSAIFNYSSTNHLRVLTVIPWYHVYGLLTTIQYIVTGNKLVFLSELNTDIFLGTISKYKITEIPAVPPILVMLAKSPLVHKYDLSSIEIIWCAAAPVAIEILESAKQNLRNCKGIYQGYGMTEATLAAMKELDSNDISCKSGSCGVPLPGIEAKVVDVGSEENLEPHQIGEVRVRGPIKMKGYVENEQATLHTIDAEGFIKTGDLGYYDEDGCFYIIDRLKDIIKYKGHQVAPATVEGIIIQHSGVSDCAVVGTPDEMAGELPTAFVVLKPNVTLTEAELLEFTASKLSPISRLRGGIIFVEEIPKNSSGKNLRRVLRNKLLRMFR